MAQAVLLVELLLPPTLLLMAAGRWPSWCHDDGPRGETNNATCLCWLGQRSSRLIVASYFRLKAGAHKTSVQKAIEPSMGPRTATHPLTLALSAIFSLFYAVASMYNVYVYNGERI